MAEGIAQLALNFHPTHPITVIERKSESPFASNCGSGSTRLPWGIRTATTPTGCGMIRYSSVGAIALPRLKGSPHNQRCRG